MLLEASLLSVEFCEVNADDVFLVSVAQLKLRLISDSQDLW
jgi:hypothetical protein